MRDWAGFGENRIFTVIALGLVGLLILGLLGIGGLILFTRLRGPATPTVVAELTPTAAPTKVPTATPTKAPAATPTKAPTATPTKAPTATPTRAATPSPTPIVTPTPTEEGVPDTGGAPLEGALVGSFLAILILVSRRLRLAGRS